MAVCSLGAVLFLLSVCLAPFSPPFIIAYASKMDKMEILLSEAVLLKYF